MRNGIMTYAVPDLAPSSCGGCCMRAKESVSCRWNASLYEKKCAESHAIYIEATPEAYATYITQRIQKGLQS
jgi:hypothetical protein